MDEVLSARLTTHRLAPPWFSTPVEAVATLAAVQAQDYLGSLWGIAQRCADAREAAVEDAIASRAIVRGWPMRGTLHFTLAEDLGWLTALLAPRVVRRAAARYRELGLDDTGFATCRRACERALAGGVVLGRDEMYALFASAGVAPDGQRGFHVLGQLAMTGLLCFGPRRGKEFTFTLLDEWVPRGRALAGDEALAELATRYFRGHAPALLADFAWWSGLGLAECKRAIAAAGRAIADVAPPGSSRSHADAPRVHLLPPYDEYTVGYRERGAFLDAADAARLKNGIFSPVVLHAGRIAGTWKRERRRDRVIVRCELIAKVPRAELADAAARYGAFLGTPAELA